MKICTCTYTYTHIEDLRDCGCVCVSACMCDLCCVSVHCWRVWDLRVEWGFQNNKTNSKVILQYFLKIAQWNHFRRFFVLVGFGSWYLHIFDERSFWCEQFIPGKMTLETVDPNAKQISEWPSQVSFQRLIWKETSIWTILGFVLMSKTFLSLIFCGKGMFYSTGELRWDSFQHFFCVSVHQPLIVKFDMNSFMVSNCCVTCCSCCVACCTCNEDRIEYTHRNTQRHKRTHRHTWINTHAHTHRHVRRQKNVKWKKTGNYQNEST